MGMLGHTVRSHSLPQPASVKETTFIRFLCLCRNLTKSKRENNKNPTQQAKQQQQQQQQQQHR
ncbi:mastermind-like domain-containing protein 1 [Drosophila sulfurigaster albostrigata]|uniref:mastermind-like domain-containing protein 1 n=1 Tax=Drosophila sulfurigaster albostrigata TaxID=89887 RepID=UPI002D219BB4|nr:mastermind-like domain-containing protein 1 [Drosophila sulfurigaster albostrigata]